MTRARRGSRLGAGLAGELTPAVVAAVAALAAFVHGGLFVLARRPDVRRLAGDEFTYLEAAQRLLAGEPASTELLWPPLYPRLLAALEALASWLRPADVWHMAEIELVQTALLVLAGLCAARLALLLGVGARGAALVALGVVAYPPLAAFAHYLWPEVVHLAFFLAALVVLIEAGVEAGARHRPPTFAASRSRAARSRALAFLRPLVLRLLGGVLLGLALLTKSLLTGFVPILLLAVGLDAHRLAVERRARSPRTRRISPTLRALAAPCLVLVGLGLTVAPTVAQNHRATGLWTIADSSSFNLWVGLQDDTRRNHLDELAWHSLEAYRAASPDPRARRAFARAEITDLVERQGLVATAWRQASTQYFRLFHRESYFTDQLPGGLLAQAGSGYLATPRPLATALRLASWALYALLLVAAAWGLVLELVGSPLNQRRRAVWRWVLVAFLAYNLVLFFGLHVKTRYRAQLVPLLLLWAAMGLESPPWRRALAGRFVAGRFVAGRRARSLLIGAGLLAAIALVLAFGAAW